MNGYAYADFGTHVAGLQPAREPSNKVRKRAAHGSAEVGQLKYVHAAISAFALADERLSDVHALGQVDLRQASFQTELAQ